MPRYRGRKRVRVGIAGCGAIGSILARACAKELRGRVVISGVYDPDARAAGSLRKGLAGRPPVLPLPALIKRSDLIVEAASGAAAPAIARKALAAGRDCMIMSVGGLLGREKGLFKLARRMGRTIYIPSGAIAGLDGLKAAACGRIASVTLTTRKPPRGLEGVDYLERRGIRVGSLKKDTAVFRGTAGQAVKAFPRNINVSAVLSIAGIGAARTRVVIIASPGLKSNVHEIRVAGDCGTITVRCENVPSKANPKTSALAALSAVATLKSITGAVRPGT